MKSNDGKETKKEKIVYHRNTVILDSWKNCFGRNSNIIRFEFIHDKNNWEVMRPASVFRMCGNITDNIMQRVHSEIDTLTTEFLKETEKNVMREPRKLLNHLAMMDIKLFAGRCLHICVNRQ